MKRKGATGSLVQKNSKCPIFRVRHGIFGVFQSRFFSSNTLKAYSHENRIDPKKLPARRGSGDRPSDDGIPLSGRPGGRWKKSRQAHGLPVEQLRGLPEGILSHNRWD